MVVRICCVRILLHVNVSYFLCTHLTSYDNQRGLEQSLGRNETQFELLIIELGFHLVGDIQYVQ